MPTQFSLKHCLQDIVFAMHAREVDQIGVLSDHGRTQSFLSDCIQELVFLIFHVVYPEFQPLVTTLTTAPALITGYVEGQTNVAVMTAT